MGKDILKELYEVVLDRKTNPQEGSYTCYLFEKGLDKILKKVGEECAETIIASKNTKDEDLVGEICDLIYHLTVLMAEREIPLEKVYEELDKRSAKIGNLKQMKNVDRNTWSENLLSLSIIEVKNRRFYNKLGYNTFHLL